MACESLTEKSCGSMTALSWISFIRFPRLARFRILLLFGFFVSELAEVNDTTHRGVGGGGNLNQVKALFPCQTQGVGQGHHATLLFLGVKDSYLARADLSIDAQQWLARFEGTKRESAQSLSWVNGSLHGLQRAFRRRAALRRPQFFEFLLNEKGNSPCELPRRSFLNSRLNLGQPLQ